MAARSDKPNLEQLLSSYIDGTCSEQERRQVEQALQRDPQLRALHAELSRTVDAIRAVPSEAAPSHVRERILAQLERRALLGEGPKPGATRDSRRGPPTAWLGMLAAAMLVAGVGVTWWIHTHQEKAPMQLAMAPTRPADQRAVVRETIPHAEPGRMQADAAEDQAAGEGDNEYAMKAAEAPSAGTSEPMQTFTREIAPPTAALTRQTPRQSTRGTILPAPRRAEDSPRSVEHMAGPEAASVDAVAAAPAPVENVTTDVARPGRRSQPAHERAAEAAPWPAQAREILATGLSYVAPTQSVGQYRPEGQTAAVQQLLVSIRDADRQVALANEFIRSRIVARGGQAALQADPSVILAADPMGWDSGLLLEIRQAPGVVDMQSTLLSPDSDPLASQAFSLAADQQCRQVAEEFVAWASAPEAQVRFPYAPPIVPQPSMPPVVPMVIVLQPVAPTVSQPASQ